MKEYLADQAKPLAKSLSAKRIKNITSWFLGVVLVVLLVTWLNLPWRPDVKGIPPDSGFYAYIGKALLHGQVLYRDVWDDKPPLGYYLNAAALAIFGQSPWGLWWSEIIWITACTLLFFLVLRKHFGSLTAGLSSALFLLALMNPQIFQGGNLMEVYALAPQVGIIAVVFSYFKNPRNPWNAILAGVLTAAAYLVKQPTIVMGCAALLVMVISLITEWNLRQAFLVIARFILGFAGVVALVASYWLAIGALGYFVDGALLQGFSFIGGAESHLRENFFYTLVNVLPYLSIGWLYLIALLAGGIFLLEKLIRFWMKPLLKAGLAWFEWLLLIGLLAFPLVASLVWPRSWTGKFWLGSILGLGLFISFKFYHLSSRPKVEQVLSPLEWAWIISIIALPFEVLMTSLGGRYFGHYFITMIPAIVLTISYPLWKAFSGLRLPVRAPIKKSATAFYFIPAILAIVWGGFSLPAIVPAEEYSSNIQAIFLNIDISDDLEKYILQTTQSNDKVLVWHIHLGINFVTNRQAPTRVLFPLNLFIPPTTANTRIHEFLGELEANPPALILVQNNSSLSLPFVDQPIDQSCDIYCTPEFVQALKVPQIEQEWYSLQHFFYAHYTLEARIYDWKVYRRLP